LSFKGETSLKGYVARILPFYVNSVVVINWWLYTHTKTAPLKIRKKNKNNFIEEK